MMKEQDCKNKVDNVCRRSYYGSLFLLFFLFLFFIYKTSFCSKTIPELKLEESSEQNIATDEISSSDNSPDSASKQVSDSNKHTQKNKIKELTVNKKLVNINTASVDELTELKGIGKKIASEIVKFRNDSGGFRANEDLMKVKGIGTKKYLAIKDYIILK